MGIMFSNIVIQSFKTNKGGCHTVYLACAIWHLETLLKNT